MEDTSRAGTSHWVLITAIAPVAWGSTYYVTHEYLPADIPFWGAVFRALPAGMLLLLVVRRLPRGAWWWKAAVLGSLNMSAFFVLVYLAAQLLPTSAASVVMATAPFAMMGFGWLLLAERPALAQLGGAVLGVGGVAVMLATAATRIDPLGIAASVGAIVLSSIGYVLARRWSGEVPVLASTAWQLTFGGAVLVPVALLVEGLPPALSAQEAAGFAFVSVVATAVAFAAWFTGLRHLRAARVGLIGLLNPVTGVLLGTLVAGEAITVQQAIGIVLVLAGVLLGQRTTGKRRG